MPSYLVSANLGIGKKTTESKFKIESNGIIASAIVNRAYKIEKERGPLIF